MTAIMCANLPAFPSLYRHVTGKGNNKTTAASSGHNGTWSSTFTRSFFRQWFDMKTTSLRQSTARRGAGSKMEEGSISQTNLTSGKGLNSVTEIKELDAMTPAKSSPYTNYVSGVDGDKNVTSVTVSSPTRESRYFGNSMPVSKPASNSTLSGTVSEQQNIGLSPNQVQNEGRIYRTDEVNVETSIVWFACCNVFNVCSDDFNFSVVTSILKV